MESSKANPIKPLVEVTDISFSTNNKNILKNISLTILPAEILTIIGPNGAGKSTFLKLLLGLIPPTSGKIISRPGLCIGYMPQQINITSLIPITVARFLAMTPNTDKTKILEQANTLGFDNLLNAEILSLSGGELQRVLLARAVLNQPELLILDEPTAGVDVAGQSELYKIITNLQQKYKFAVLMVSHDLHLVMSGTDKVICLNKHVCCSGYPESVVKHPEFIELFGQTNLSKLAVYTHHHDHDHDLKGEIIDDKTKPTN